MWNPVGKVREPGGQVTQDHLLAGRVARTSGYAKRASQSPWEPRQWAAAPRWAALVATRARASVCLSAAAASASKRSSYGCVLPTTNHIEPEKARPPVKLDVGRL